MASTPPQGQIYDAVASAYDVIWSVPAMRILFPLLDTQLRLLGPWDGKAALDMACGTGIGLRLMTELGASKVVGVDISGEMLEVARTTSSNAGLELHHADCSKSMEHLGLEKGGFDLVLGMWLLSYPESREAMSGMWRNIAAYLKPGATFVGIVQNQDVVQPSSMQGQMARYGVQEADVRPLASGDGWKMRVEFNTVPKVEFDTFLLEKEILEGEALAAGLVDLRYIRPGEEVKGEVPGMEEEWWRELLEEYPNQLVVATKG